MWGFGGIDQGPGNLMFIVEYMWDFEQEMRYPDQDDICREYGRHFRLESQMLGDTKVTTAFNMSRTLHSALVCFGCSYFAHNICRLAYFGFNNL